MASDAFELNSLMRQVLRLADETHRLADGAFRIINLMEAAELRARQQDQARQAITDAFAFVEHPNAVLDWQKAVAEQRTMLGFTDWLEKEAGNDHTTTG